MVKQIEIDYNETWPTVLSTVRSLISMSRYGHIDISTWHARFSGLKQQNYKKIICLILN